MGMSKGLQEFVERYSKPIVVELRRGGYAVKMKQPSGMIWAGFAGGLPSGQTEMNPAARKQKEEESRSEKEDYQLRMRRMVAAAIFELRTPSANGSEKWERVRFVEDREPEPKADPPEISMDVLDYVDNVTRCFNALVMDVAGGEEMAATEAEGFRDKPGAMGRVRRAR